MRKIGFLFAAILLTSTSALAGQSASGDPVSLDRIRKALEAPPPVILPSLERKANFSSEVREKQRGEELLSTLKVPTGGFVPPEGPYAWEIQHVTNNPVDNPLTQPYSEFSEGQLLVVALENVIGQPLAHHAIEAIRRERHEHQVLRALYEVRRAMSQFCAANPADTSTCPDGAWVGSH
jgi:hypothetical protein